LPARGVALSATGAIQLSSFRTRTERRSETGIVGSYSHEAASSLPYRRTGKNNYATSEARGPMSAVVRLAQSNKPLTDLAPSVYRTAFAISSPTDSTAN